MANISQDGSSAFPNSFSGKVVKREMLICTFVYKKINLRDERRLGLILSFIFRQLEGEFAVSLPCSANSQSSVSELPGRSVVYGEGCLFCQFVWQVLFLFLHLSIEAKNHQLCFCQWYSVVLLVP